MGRAKVKMELISKEKSRSLTFKKRKQGLIRKLHEFTTLCDVSACMIIYGPKQENSATSPEIWPQNMDEFRRIIGIYRAKNKDSGNKTFGLSDFFHGRKKKVEEELAKLRKTNMEVKYPTWIDVLNFATESQLREFATSLSNKAEYVKSRIEFLRRNRQGFDMDFAHPRLNQSQGFYYPGIRRGIDLGVRNQESVSCVHVPIHHYPTIDHHQDLYSMKQNNSMMMLLMNENDQFVQFGGASTSANIHYMAPPCVPPPPYAQWNMMVAPPQPPPSIRGSHGGDKEDDILQYHMENHQSARYLD